MEDQIQSAPPVPPVRLPPPPEAPPAGFNYVVKDGAWVLEPNPVAHIQAE